MNGSIEDLENGYNVWVDIADHDIDKINDVSHKFSLNEDAVEACCNKSKKPEIRQFDDHTFSVLLEMKNKDPETLLVEAIYFFVGKNWLITVHSTDVNLMQIAERIFHIKNETIKQTRIDALYYSMLAEIVSKYEQLLTGLELSVTDYQRQSFVKPLPAIFDSIDTLSRQAITLRRHFWHIRNVVNVLLHTEQEKDDVKYVKIVHDDISQLIDFVEYYESTINSIRELYVAKVSLQINETMRILTIFTAVLLPLTLLAGIYGMNGMDLNNITDVPVGFGIVTVSMLLTTIGLIVFFIKKKWLLAREPKLSKQKFTEKQVNSRKSNLQDKQSNETPS
jgi:magnesium transporter